MKTFLTFLGLLVVCLSLLCFTSDMDRYAKLQTHMKALAEDCAAGSILFTDDEAYSQGLVVFREADAEDYVDFMLGKAQGGPLYLNGHLAAELRLFDDEKGYDGLIAYHVRQMRPCSVVTLFWEGPDLFRLPFFRLTTAKRTAVYEWVD
jgi:hypothetical protein